MKSWLIHVHLNLIPILYLFLVFFSSNGKWIERLLNGQLSSPTSRLPSHESFQSFQLFFKSLKESITEIEQFYKDRRSLLQSEINYFEIKTKVSIYDTHLPFFFFLHYFLFFFLFYSPAFLFLLIHSPKIWIVFS